ncbi:MAG: sterol desaturase family protein [Verrucomicrobia bacterium]|jgi:hypothetical protein|nr:MAG: sterol desaturase family protein [Verrucomicrobiota bacterium]
MISFITWCAVGAFSGVVFSSFFEWTLHRFIMHRPLGPFRYPFEAHAIVHHQTFKADHTYHLINEEDKKTIPMAWWNGPVLVFFCQMPMLIAAIIWQKWAILVGGAVACSAYYATYEYIHWCMHLPRKRFVERSGVFFRLNGHHLLHHRYMGKNFNVVFPLADLLLGTLVIRSQIKFAQPQGPFIPNVQPKLTNHAAHA